MVSIIIPAYNRCSIIGETLESIRQQTHREWECLIVDDGSSDATPQVVAGFVASDSRFHYLERPEHLPKGANSCRNYGFEKSTGSFILWFDSDDILLPDALRHSMNRFRETTDAVISKVRFTDLASGAIKQDNTIASQNLISDYLTGAIGFYVCGPVWRKEFLNKQELFDPKLSNLDDWDFNLRMLYRKPDLEFVDQVAVLYRWHPVSLSNEIGRLNGFEIDSEFRARKKHLGILHNSDPENHKILLGFMFKRYRFLLREALVRKAYVRNKLFRDYVSLLFQNHRFAEMVRATAAFAALSVFKKGYKLLS